MDDLVEWLRRMARPWKSAANYYTEAADEIERLRARVAELEVKYCPGHTDMMVSEDALNEWLDKNPPPLMPYDEQVREDAGRAVDDDGEDMSVNQTGGDDG